MTVRAEDSHDHPEAVIQRHRYAHPVLFRVRDPLADEESVVEDVVVRKGCTLREAGRSRGVLNVDGVIERQGLRPLSEKRPVTEPARCDDGFPFVAADEDHTVERGLRQHRSVVAALEGPRADHEPQIGLPNHIAHFAGSVGRIDIDENRADLRRRVLSEHPLRAVGRPDAHPVTLRDPELDQAHRQVVHSAAQVGEREPALARPIDEGNAVGKSLRDLIELLTDRLPQEWQLADAR